MPRLLAIGLALGLIAACVLPALLSAGTPLKLPVPLTLEQRVATLEKTVATLQGQVAALQKQVNAPMGTLQPGQPQTESK